jgi:hypothetical protein
MEDHYKYKEVPMTRDVISRFNRDTVWLATGVLGTVVFAALVLAVQEHQPKGTLAESDLLLNANPATVGNVVAKSSNSKGKMTAGPGSSVDHAFSENRLQEIPSSQTETAASTPTSLPARAWEPTRGPHFLVLW